ncbi:zf-HC2 domain-containing protein [Streptomyces palmae]|uniref:Zf-HC2 domain-containing protein n=1 Tax=Streptomyces palmae TaxID=1701085 RepID=A0A4Z0FZP6_9ACTN|nr:zf-HC2 domain-containing protein [Streptomyces palmae]TGA88846.1 zf-HC2 domain-containing protein [Streptomyces palmae]
MERPYALPSDAGPPSSALPPAAVVSEPPPAPAHRVLRSLLGAWALAACSSEETAAVEAHLNHCVPCAEEALRLRDAVGLLHPEGSLDLDPLLRSRVLAGCLGRRPPRIPVPEWAGAFDAEAARLDALLGDMGAAEWRAPVRLKWFDGQSLVERRTTVAGVIGHLMAVDGLLAGALGLPDPLGGAPGSPLDRTEALRRTEPPTVPLPGEEEAPEASDDGPDPEPGRRGRRDHHPGAVRKPWRAQVHTLVRTVSFASQEVWDRPVPLGDLRLRVRDSFVDRAFGCWVHAGDIAEAVDYPYRPPASGHLHQMVDLYARLLPDTLAARRRAGLAAPPRRLGAVGAPGRSLRLEIEGSGGGHWFIPLDSPGALAGPEGEVAHIALDRDTFYQLASGHVPPLDAAAGQVGDPEAIREVLLATASLSRL